MIKKYLFVLPCLVFLLCGSIFQKAEAVTSNPNPVHYTQHDGSVITILLKGDEFIHWATTIDGYTLLSNKNRSYEYAMNDSKGNLSFSGIIAHDPKARGTKETTFLQKTDKGLFFSALQITEMKQLLFVQHAPAATTGGFPTTGVNAHLMILANFSNTTTTYTQSNFNNLLNQVNYNNTGSFKDYYLEVSYGALTINTDVTLWVDLPNPHDYYGPQSKWGTFAYDAMVAADLQAGVDFSIYDNNADGIVDGICIAHQGRGQEESGSTNDIWSHSWDLAAAGYSASQRTFDGVQVLDYTTIPEKGGPSSMTTIGVMCHEFGHNLGAPDFYDTDYGTGGQYDGTGTWDIMANGSWNGNPAGAVPAHHNPWTKTFFTWSAPIILTSQQKVLVRNAQAYPDIFRYNTPTTNEYFLCENRQKTGFDKSIPGHGLIIYHVDGNYINSHHSANNINCTSHQGLYPMSATSTTINGIMLSSGSTINSGGCPWPGTTNKSTFTDATKPSSKSWAGANTNLPLIKISENTATREVTFCFITCADINDPSNFTSTPVSTSQINLSWGKNGSHNPVMVAYSLHDTIGVPETGNTYVAGDTIPGGGVVIYNGNDTVFNHTGLAPNTTYYYKAWSVMTGLTYSPGVVTNATTFCSPFTLPFTETFSSSVIPGCWSQADHQGNGQIWHFGVITGQSPSPNLTGNYAFLNSSAYGSGSIQNADLVTPTLNMTGLTNITLEFSHYFKEHAGSSGSVSYSIDNGTTWTIISTYTANSATNPEIFNEVIGALAGQSQVKIKWNYTGTFGYYWAIDDVHITGTIPTPILVVTPLNQNVPETAGSTMFNVTSNTNWTVTSDQNWCTVTNSGTCEGTITAEFTDNQGIGSRVANISISVSGISPVVVTVTQAGVIPILEVTPSNQDVSALAGSTFFNVTSNSKWTVTSDQLWCTTPLSGENNDTIPVNYTKNSNSTPRVATLTITVNGLPPVYTTITQDGFSGISLVDDKEIILMPNPNNGTFTIKGIQPANREVKVTIFDMKGKTVFSKEYHESVDYEFDLRPISKGEYFIRIKSSGKVMCRKLVIH